VATLRASNPIEVLHAGRIEIHLTVQTTGGTPTAAQVADAAADVIRDRFARAWDGVVARHRAALPARQKEAAAAGDALAKARARVTAAEAKLREETGRIDLSAAGMQAAQDALELERQRIELDLAGLKARREGLQQAVAEQAFKARDAQAQDPAVAALVRAVDASKARLQQVRQMHAAGTAPTTEVSQAEVAELEAEARLAERRNAAGGSVEAMAQWNRALTDATIEQREKEARLSAATKRLGALIDAAARRQDLEAARQAELQAAGQQSNAEAAVRETTAWLERYGDARLAVEVRRRDAAAPE
jgi:hypothetical protein